MGILHLYLGKKLKVIPLDGSEPFEDYLEGHYYGSHFVTSRGIEIDMMGCEAISTRKHIPVRNPEYEIQMV